MSLLRPFVSLFTTIPHTKDELPLLLLLSHFSRVQLCATHRWQPTRLPRPWDSPGKNTGVGYHFPLQCMKVKSESEGAQSCPRYLETTVLTLGWDLKCFQNTIILSLLLSSPSPLSPFTKCSLSEIQAATLLQHHVEIQPRTVGR